jgi:hypothetical protein
MNLLVMQFPPVSRHFISLRTKYSQHPVLKHPPQILQNIDDFYFALSTMLCAIDTRKIVTIAP